MRALQVTLTEAGQRAAAAFQAEASAELCRLAEPLAPRDREHFRGAMAEIIAARRTARSAQCLMAAPISAGPFARTNRGSTI